MTMPLVTMTAALMTSSCHEGVPNETVYGHCKQQLKTIETSFIKCTDYMCRVIALSSSSAVALSQCIRKCILVLFTNIIVVIVAAISSSSLSYHAMRSVMPCSSSTLSIMIV